MSPLKLRRANWALYWWSPCIDVVSNVASSCKSLKCVLNGILKYFTCGTNSERKLFVAKQTTMSDECGDGSRLFILKDLMIASFEVNFAEFCCAQHILQQLINCWNRMTFLLDCFIGLAIITTYTNFRGAVVFGSDHKSANPISGFILDSFSDVFIHVIIPPDI